MGIGSHAMAKIQWRAVKMAQAELAQLRATVIKPVAEVSPAELVLSGALHGSQAPYTGVQHQPQGVICCVQCQVIWKVSLSRPSVLKALLLPLQCQLYSVWTRLSTCTLSCYSL